MNNQPQHQTYLLQTSSIDHDNKDDNFVKQPLPTNRRKAVIYQTLGCIFSSLFQIVSKYDLTSLKIYIFDLLLARGIACLITSIILLKCYGVSLSVERSQRKYAILRASSSVCAFTLLVAGLQFIPLVLANTLFNTSPFFAALFAWITFGNRLSSLQWVALVVSFGAIVMIYLATSQEEELGGIPIGLVAAGCILEILAGAAFAGATIFNRLLTGLAFPVILFYTGVIASSAAVLMSLVDYLVNGTSFQTLSYTGEQYGLAFLAVAFNVAYTYFFVIACQNDNPAFLQILIYSCLVYAFLADYFIFENPVQGFVQLVRIGVLVVMNVTLVLDKLRAK